MADKLQAIIIAHLRRIGYRNVHRAKAFEASKVERGAYKCAACGQLFKRTELDGDHVEPVVEVNKGFVDWNTYIHRLFYGQIQVLCKPCHKTKTALENAERWE